MVMQPVGPLPPSTYWRRRGVLLLVVLLLLVLLVKCTSPGSTTKKTASTTTPTATASATPRATARATPRATAKATASPTAAPTVSKPPVQAITCRNADLALSGSTDQAAYTVGESPRLSVKVTNKGATACTVDLGTGAVELLVFSGPARQWSSDDCNPSTAKAPTRLAAGAAQSVVVSWSGTRSQPGCSGAKAKAAPGTYRLVGRIGTLSGQVAVFRFHS